MSKLKRYYLDNGGCMYGSPAEMMEDNLCGDYCLYSDMIAMQSENEELTSKVDRLTSRGIEDMKDEIERLRELLKEAKEALWCSDGKLKADLEYRIRDALEGEDETN